MASTELSRTPTTAGNRKTWTFSAWIKRAKISSGYPRLFSSYQSNNDRFEIYIHQDDTITIESVYGASQTLNLKTNRKFRDTNGWYHIVVAIDTTQATSSDRVKLYINGVQETSFSSSTYMAQDQNTSTNDTYIHYIGETGYNSGGQNFDGLMSHVHLTDGTAYSASTFGSTDSTTGQWKINTNPSVTYGTNGFFLFKDNASVSDQSGNSNDFTASGTLTPTEDCPSNVFATWNPIAFENAGGTRLSNGNTRADGESSAAHNLFVSTLAVSSGKWYFEAKLGAAGGDKPWIGIRDVDGSLALGQFVGQVADSLAYGNGQLRTNDSTLETGLATYTTGDIIGVALDLDSAQNKCYFYKNGTLVNSGGRNIDNKTYCFAVSQYQNTGHWLANFGNGYFGTTAITSEGTNASGIGKFEYDVPTGYTALSTKGLNE